MSAGNNEAFPQEILEVVSDRDCDDFTRLLEGLDDLPQDKSQVTSRVNRVANSKTATLIVARDGQQGRLVSTATISRVPILTGRGSRAWIDDVVTDPDKRGQGLVTGLMDQAEASAASFAPEVLLTSGTKREGARQLYEKRGYVLSSLGVYRNSNPAKATTHDDWSSAVSRLDDYTESDVETMAQLLGETPQNLEINLRAALEADGLQNAKEKTTAIFAIKRKGAIEAVAAASLVPIPYGVKPWVDNLTGSQPGDTEQVLEAAEQWLTSPNRDAPFVNIVAHSPEGLLPGYVLRDTGLFIKPLVMIEAI